MDTIMVSAPGKVIIHGEHAVVFGKRALAGSLGLRTELTLQHTNDQSVVVNLPDIGIRLQWDCKTIVNSFTLPLCNALSPSEISIDALNHLKQFTGIDDSVTDTKQLATIAFLYLFCSIAPVNSIIPSVCISVSSKLPTSAGLGSSAAFSTCLAAGLLVSSKLVLNPMSLTADDRELINRWSFMSEKIIHGRLSGIDNSVSTYGGALCYQAGKIEPIDRMPEFHILLINTRVPRSTKLLVEAVKRKHDKFPDIIEPVLNSIEAIAAQCELILSELCTTQHSEELLKDLEELIDMNRHHLDVLGVGHSSLDTVYSIAAKYQLHTKLTGAGGGGCAFALIPHYISRDAVDKATQEMIRAGFDCFTTSLGGPGVIVSVTTAKDKASTSCALINDCFNDIINDNDLTHRDAVDLV